MDQKYRMNTKWSGYFCFRIESDGYYKQGMEEHNAVR